MEIAPAPVGMTAARITVVAPRMRLDVAIPADVPLAALLPTLLWHTGEQAVEAGATHGGWSLQRLGEPPLDTARTCAALGIVDGDTVYFRPRDVALPEFVYDDAVDGIGSILRDRTKRWDATATRRCALVSLGLVPLFALAPLALAGPGHTTPSVLAAVSALVLIAAAGALSRAAGDGVAGAFAGAAAMPLAALAGLLAPLGSRPLSAIGAPHLATAGAAAFVVAVLGSSFVGVGVVAGPASGPGSGSAARPLPPAGAAAGNALLAGAIPAGVFSLTALAALRWNAAGCAALASAVALSLMVLIPRIAYRAAGLPRTIIARDAADLRALSTPLPTAELTARSLTADRLVTALVAGCALSTTAGAAFALRAPGWAPPNLAAIVAVLLALCVRLFGAVAQRWWLVGSALVLAAAAAAGVAARWPGGTGLTIDLCVTVVATAAVAPFALKPDRRFAPTLARRADLIELLGTVATIPLALLIIGVFGYLRSLSG